MDSRPLCADNRTPYFLGRVWYCIGGSLITIYIVAVVFLLAVLGLLISTYSNTLQAMLISFL